MRLESLQIRSFRNLAAVELRPGPGVNWLYGVNGAGKTSVLEAIHVLGRGRSFRTGNLAALLRDGDPGFRVVAETAEPSHRLGLERTGSDWTGRIDRQPCRRMSEFAQAMPLVLVDPENHLLVEGGPSHRRSFIDWGLFHVEHSYLADWQGYRRLLGQRNAALRRADDDAVLDALERPMAEVAGAVEGARARYVERLQRHVAALEAELRFEIPALSLGYRPGAVDSGGYAEAWEANRRRDREHGFTREGPHRAELTIRSGERRAAPRLSRGQMKLAALVLKLAQMRLGGEQSVPPLLLLDDPVSELDAHHLERLIAWINTQHHQSWITAVEPPECCDARLFHVEQGKIRSVV